MLIVFLHLFILTVPFTLFNQYTASYNHKSLSRNWALKNPFPKMLQPWVIKTFVITIMMSYKEESYANI